MTKLLPATLFALALSGSAFARVNISVNIGAPPYYGYAPADVYYVERYVPDYYVPQVFYTARCAHVAPSVVVGMYRNGWGWDRIYGHYGIPAYGARYYAAPPPRYYGNGYDYGYYRSGPPYGNAWGHYKKHHKKFKHRGRDWDDD